MILVREVEFGTGESSQTDRGAVNWDVFMTSAGRWRFPEEPRRGSKV